MQILQAFGGGNGRPVRFRLRTADAVLGERVLDPENADDGRLLEVMRAAMEATEAEHARGPVPDAIDAKSGLSAQEAAAQKAAIRVLFPRLAE